MIEAHLVRKMAVAVDMLDCSRAVVECTGPNDLAVDSMDWAVADCRLAEWRTAVALVALCAACRADLADMAHIGRRRVDDRRPARSFPVHTAVDSLCTADVREVVAVVVKVRSRTIDDFALVALDADIGGRLAKEACLD